MKRVESSIPSFYEPVLSSDVLAEADSVPGKIADHNADGLPFAGLGGRRFEILSYLLVTSATTDSHEIVTLVKASGDQGRDIVVHRGGRLKTVIQCKNLEKAFSRPALLRELTKFALFDRLEHFVPAEGIRYEIWAPNGFTEPASELLTSWPNALDETEVRDAFLHLTAKHKTLQSLTWNDCAEHLLLTFPSRTTLGGQNGLRLSARVRAEPSLHARYFEATIVMKRGDVEAVLDDRLGGNGLFRPLAPGSGDKRTIDRFLDLEARGLIVRDPVIARHFSDIIEAHRAVLILGASGSGKTTTALDLARSLDNGCCRVFVVGNWIDADEDRIVNGIRARADKPSVFVIDDVHSNFAKAESAVRRTLHECQGRPVRLILTAHTARGAEQEAFDPQADLIEDFLENESSVFLAPEVSHFGRIAERTRPDLAPITEQEAKVLWQLVAGDLELLRHVLMTIGSRNELEELNLGGLLDATLKRYFGRKHVEARSVERIAAIAQFDVPIPVAQIAKPLEPAYPNAVQRLIVEDGRPLVYRFAHRAVAELTFQALCRAHGHDPISAAIAHIASHVQRENVVRGPDAFMSVLSTRLRLMDQVEFRSRFLADPAIFGALVSLDHEERLRVLHLATQSTKSSEVGERYRCALTESLLTIAAACAQADARTFVNVFVQFLHALRNSDAEHADRLEKGIGAYNLVRLMRLNGTIFDLMKVLRHCSEQFASSILGSLNRKTTERLVSNAILSGRSIGTLTLRMMEFGSRKLPDGRHQLEAFETALGAPSMLRLICSTGTLVDLMKCLAGSTVRFADELLESLDDAMLSKLVERTIESRRSIGTIGLTLRELSKRTMSGGRNQAEALEQKLGNHQFLRLLTSHGTIVELLSVLHYASSDTAHAVLVNLDQVTANELVLRTVATKRSIGTCNLSVRRLHRKAPAATQRFLMLVGSSGWWALLAGNGDFSDLSRLIKDIPEPSRADLLETSVALPVEHWARLISRSPFQSICRFLCYELRRFPTNTQDAIGAALVLNADVVTESASWHSLAKGLALLKDVAAGPVYTKLRQAALVRFENLSLHDTLSSDPVEAINSVQCLWDELPNRRKEVASNLWSLLPSHEPWMMSPQMLIAARFLLRICCAPIIEKGSAHRAISTFAQLPESSVRELHSTPLCYFLWNFFALWFERGRPMADEFEPLQSPMFWNNVIEVVHQRVRSRGTWEERADHLSLAGTLVTLVPSTKARVEQALRGTVAASDAERLWKVANRLTFLPAYFLFVALVLVTSVPRPVFNARKKQLRSKFDDYEDSGPALTSLFSRI